MSDNPRHIVQRYYVPVSQSNISGVWSMREEMQETYSGNWVPAGVIPVVNYLVIGGGGSGADGGGQSGGGSGSGGAGGVVVGSFGPTYKQPESIYGYTLTITVGAGGATSVGQVNGNTGGNSIISGQFLTLGPLIAYGGGYGPFRGSGAKGGDGGSGGGQAGWNDGIAHDNLPGLALQPTSLYGGYGNNGGYHNSGGAGGGGAGGPGVVLQGGPGLFVNVANYSSYSGTFASGGTKDAAAAPSAGSGGGGGKGGITSSQPGFAGRDGTIILWWNVTFPAPSDISGTFSTSIENGFRIYKFSEPGGTITF